VGIFQSKESLDIALRYVSAYDSTFPAFDKTIYTKQLYLFQAPLTVPAFAVIQYCFSYKHLKSFEMQGES